MSVNMIRSVEQIRRISRATDAREVALGTYERLLELLEQLEPQEWRTPTECDGWDVAAMVGHVIGAGKAGATQREAFRQQRWAKRHADGFDGNSLDATNELQVRDHAELTPEQRIAELRRIAPAAVRGRMRFPRPLRRITLRLDQGGSNAAGMPTRLSLGHAVDVIYTRDVWLHRVDIARATGRPVGLDGDSDRRIVEDVVAEWAERHGQPFRLTLHGGQAGGEFHQGQGGPHLECDVVEYCRILSGRAPAEGLLATRVLF
jgi:uncharacterized protein (TIGR03083 family)